MQFSKMHGLGNDFVVVDAVTQNAYFTPETIKRLADRHRGIGFDQLLIVEPPYDPDLDFHYRIFNADGSEVSQCGNGARCVARFVTLKGLTNKKDIAVSTQKGKMVLTVKEDGQIVVARIEDEVTVKRLERKGSVIYLHAENEEFQPIVVNLEEQPHFEIEGIAVGIIRNNAWM